MGHRRIRGKVPALVLGLLTCQLSLVAAEQAPAPAGNAQPGVLPQPTPAYLRLRNLVANLLGINPAHIRPDSRLREDLGADSLDTYELIYEVEEEFGVTISDETAVGLVTFDDLYQTFLLLSKP